MTLQDMPKISVITVAFNHAEFLKQNIDSVLAQNYPNFEHIIIDGGSTDGTVELLKTYPHLNWVSEPDRGQTHALNKGFKKATGDIIAWLNSDDWYPKGVFYSIAEALREKPIVLGACQLTDKEGNLTEYVPNIERSWFDILKYWVYFSSPSQPSIFFWRSVLDEIKLDNGDYLDECLDFCMDYDLWLRIAKKHHLNHRIDKTLSYYRNYDTNKTGGDMDSVYREMSRVFSRHSKIISNTERKFSFIIPFTLYSSALQESLTNICQQSLKDFEIILVDYNSDNKTSKGNRRKVLDFEKKIPQLNIRYTRCLGETALSAMAHGMKISNSEFLIFSEESVTFGQDFCFDVANLIRQDAIALILPKKNQPDLVKLQRDNQNGGKSVDISAVLVSEFIPLNFVARKASLLEVEAFSSSNPIEFQLREIILNLVSKGWYIDINENLEFIPKGRDYALEKEYCQILSNYFAAKVIKDFSSSNANDKFYELRGKHGFSVAIPEPIIENSIGLLSRAPVNFYEINFENSKVGELLDLAEIFSDFAPLYYYIAKKYEASGDRAASAQAIEKFNQLRALEII